MPHLTFRSGQDCIANQRRRGHRACRKAAVRSMRTAAHVRRSDQAKRDLNKFATPSSLRLSTVSQSVEQSRPDHPAHEDGRIVQALRFT